MFNCDTPEQAAIIGWSGRKLVVRAFAGTGKTSTLVRLALANPDSRMLYLAYRSSLCALSCVVLAYCNRRVAFDLDATNQLLHVPLMDVDLETNSIL